jgi:hypothetical protein
MIRRKVVDHGGDAVDTAEPLVKAGRILGRHWPLLPFSKVGELDTITSVGPSRPCTARQ